MAVNHGSYRRTFKHPFDGFGNIQRKWFSGTICPVVDVEDGTATGTVDVSTNDISDRDTYSVCYQGQYADGNDDAHAYCSDAKIHHGENGHITLSASYGETM